MDNDLISRSELKKEFTNAEKYQEVFGFPPDKISCLTKECDNCPINKEGLSCAATEDWWDEEYKGGECMTEEEKKIKDLIEKYRCGLIDSEECISKCHFILIDKARKQSQIRQNEVN